MSAITDGDRWHTDEELVLQARHGNEDATEALLARYWPLVKASSRRYFLIGADRADIVQEAAIGLLKAIRDYKPDLTVPFRNFAGLCVKRQVITAVKSATRAKHSPLNGYISTNKPMFDEINSRTLEDALESGDAGPEQLVIDRETMSEISSRLDALLSPYEKQVLLYYLRLSEYAAIADALGTSLKSVDNALWRIKRKMRGNRRRDCTDKPNDKAEGVNQSSA